MPLYAPEAPVLEPTPAPIPVTPPEPPVDFESPLLGVFRDGEELLSDPQFKALPDDEKVGVWNNYQDTSQATIAGLLDIGAPGELVQKANAALDHHVAVGFKRIEARDLPLSAAEVKDSFAKRPSFQALAGDPVKLDAAMSAYSQAMERIKSPEFAEGKTDVVSEFGINPDSGMYYKWRDAVDSTRDSVAQQGAVSGEAAVQGVASGLGSLANFLPGNTVGKFIRQGLLDPTPFDLDEGNPTQVGVQAALYDARMGSYAEHNALASGLGGVVGSVAGFSGLAGIARKVTGATGLAESLELAAGSRTGLSAAEYAVQAAKVSERAAIAHHITIAAAALSNARSEIGDGYWDQGVKRLLGAAAEHYVTLAASDFAAQKFAPFFSDVIAPKIMGRVEFSPTARVAAQAVGGGLSMNVMDVVAQAGEAGWDSFKNDTSFADSLRNHLEGEMDYETGERKGGYGWLQTGISFGTGAAMGIDARRAQAYTRSLALTGTAFDKVSRLAESKGWSQDQVKEALQPFVEGMLDRRGMTREELDAHLDTAKRYQKYYSAFQEAVPLMSEAQAFLRIKKDAVENAKPETVAPAEEAAAQSIKSTVEKFVETGKKLDAEEAIARAQADLAALAASKEPVVEAPKVEAAVVPEPTKTNFADLDMENRPTLTGYVSLLRRAALAGGGTILESQYLSKTGEQLGYISAAIEPAKNRLRVFDAFAHQRGGRLGIAMYQAVLEEAARLGYSVASDKSVSYAASKIYRNLQKEGYEVTQNPDAAVEQNELYRGTLTTSDGTPVFTVNPIRNKPKTEPSVLAPAVPEPVSKARAVVREKVAAVEKAKPAAKEKAKAEVRKARVESAKAEEDWRKQEPLEESDVEAEPASELPTHDAAYIRAGGDAAVRRVTTRRAELEALPKRTKAQAAELAQLKSAGHVAALRATAEKEMGNAMGALRATLKSHAPEALDNPDLLDAVLASKPDDVLRGRTALVDQFIANIEAHGEPQKFEKGGKLIKLGVGKMNKHVQEIIYATKQAREKAKKEASLEETRTDSEGNERTAEVVPAATLGELSEKSTPQGREAAVEIASENLRADFDIRFGKPEEQNSLLGKLKNDTRRELLRLGDGDISHTEEALRVGVARSLRAQFDREHKAEGTEDSRAAVLRDALTDTTLTGYSGVTPQIEAILAKPEFQTWADKLATRFRELANEDSVEGLNPNTPPRQTLPGSSEHFAELRRQAGESAKDSIAKQLIDRPKPDTTTAEIAAAADAALQAAPVEVREAVAAAKAEHGLTTVGNAVETALKNIPDTQDGRQLKLLLARGLDTLKRLGLEGKDLLLSWFDPSSGGHYQANRDEIAINPLQAPDVIHRALAHELIHKVADAKVNAFLEGRFAEVTPSEFHALLGLADAHMHAIADPSTPAVMREILESKAGTAYTNQDFKTKLSPAEQSDYRSKYYGLLNLNEFLTMTLTEPRFVEHLNSISLSLAQQAEKDLHAPTRTLWQSVKSALGTFLDGKSDKERGEFGTRTLDKALDLFRSSSLRIPVARPLDIVAPVQQEDVVPPAPTRRPVEGPAGVDQSRPGTSHLYDAFGNVRRAADVVPPAPTRRPVEGPAGVDQSRPGTSHLYDAFGNVRRAADVVPPASKAVHEVDRMVETTLAPVEKVEAAKLLGHEEWTPAAAKSFREGFADWVAGAKEVVSRLHQFFRKVLDVMHRTVLSATMIFSPAHVPDVRRGMTFDIPRSTPVPLEARVYEAAPEFETRPESERPYKITASKVAMPDIGHEALRGQRATADTRSPVGLSAPTTYKDAFFGDTAASDSVRRVAGWVVERGDQAGKPFLVADKTNGFIYTFDGNGRLLSRNPALFGKDRGDTLRGDSLEGGAKITPAGRFDATLSRDAELGETVDFMQTGDSALAVHRLYLGDPKEHRPERLKSGKPEQQRISYGCINVDESLMQNTILPAFRKDGGTVYVLPETKAGEATHPSFAGLNQTLPEEPTLADHIQDNEHVSRTEAAENILNDIPPDPGLMQTPAENPGRVHTSDERKETTAFRTLRQNGIIPSVLEQVQRFEYFADTQPAMLKEAEAHLRAFDNPVDAYRAATFGYAPSNQEGQPSAPIAPHIAPLVKHLAVMEMNAQAEHLRGIVNNPESTASQRISARINAEWMERMAAESIGTSMAGASEAGQVLAAHKLIANLISSAGPDGVAHRVAARQAYTKGIEKLQAKFLKNSPIAAEIQKEFNAAFSDAFDIAARKAAGLAPGIADIEHGSAGKEMSEFVANIFKQVDEYRASQHDGGIEPILESIKKALTTQFTKTVTDRIKQQAPKLWDIPWKPEAGDTGPSPMQRIETDIRRLVSEQLQPHMRAMYEQESSGPLSDKEAHDLLTRGILDAFDRGEVAKQVFDRALARLAADRNAYAPEYKDGIDRLLEQKPEFDMAKSKAAEDYLRRVVELREEIFKSGASRDLTIENIKDRLRDAVANGKSLTPEQDAYVTRIGESLHATYASLVEKTAQTRMEALVKAHEKTKLGNELGSVLDRQMLRKLVDYGNAGVFSNERFYNAVAHKFKLPEWDAAYAASLEKRFADIQKIESPVLRNDALIHVSNEVARKTWGELWKSGHKLRGGIQLADSLWISGVLSRPTVHLANGTYTAFQVVAESTARSFATAIEIKKAGGSMSDAAGALVDGLYGAWNGLTGKATRANAGTALLTGVSSVHADTHTHGQSSLLEGFKLSNPLKAGTLGGAFKAAGESYVGLNAVSMRLLEATDAFSMGAASGAGEATARRLMGALGEGRDAEGNKMPKLTGKALDDYVRSAGDPEGNFRAGIKSRLNEEQARGDYGTTDGLSGLALRKAQKGIEYSRTRRENELMDQQFYTPQMRKESHDFAVYSTLRSDAYGAPGMIIDGLFGMINRNFPLVGRALGVPFPRMLANAVNHIVNWGPLGFLRAYGVSASDAAAMRGNATAERYRTSGRGAMDVGWGAYAEMHPSTDPEHQAIQQLNHTTQLIRASVGTALSVAFVAWAMSGAQDEADGKKPKFTVSTLGHNDPAKAAQILESGTGGPGTVTLSIADKTMTFKFADLGALAYPLSLAGMLSDRVRYNQQTAEPMDYAIGLATASTVVTQKNLFSGMKDFMTMVQNFGTPEADRAAVRVLTRPVSGITNPGLVDWAMRMATGKAPELTTVQGTLYGLTPIAYLANKPRVNALGEPIRYDLADPTTARLGSFEGISRQNPTFKTLVQAELYVPVGRSNSIKDPIAGDPKHNFNRELTSEEQYYYKVAFAQHVGRVVTPQNAASWADTVSKNPAAREAVQKNINEVGTQARQYAEYVIRTRSFKQVDAELEAARKRQ